MRKYFSYLEKARSQPVDVAVGHVPQVADDGCRASGKEVDGLRKCVKCKIDKRVRKSKRNRKKRMRD